MKEYWNRSTFAKVILKTKVAPFFMAHGVMTRTKLCHLKWHDQHVFSLDKCAAFDISGLSPMSTVCSLTNPSSKLTVKFWQQSIQTKVSPQCQHIWQISAWRINVILWHWQTGCGSAATGWWLCGDERPACCIVDSHWYLHCKIINSCIYYIGTCRIGKL